MLLGTIVNALAIAVGTLIGVLLRSGIPSKYKETSVAALGLAIILIGLKGAWETNNSLIMIAALVLGAIIGEFLKIEDRLHLFGQKAEGYLGKGGNLGEAFVTATLVYCVGAMAIMGSLQSGLSGNHETLLAKSLLDGISSIFFASTLGPGVALSAVSVLVYQGAITLGAKWLSVLVTGPMISEMNAVGGILVIAIGLNILEVKQTRVGNLLPAIIIAALLAWF